MSGGDETVQANLAAHGWDNRAQSVVCIATTQGRRIEQARSFRGLFLDRWRRTITSGIAGELARRTIIWPTTLDPDTSMTWDMAVNSRPDPREAYVRIRQGLTIQTGAGDHHATVNYLIRINVPPGGGTPAGSPVLPWSVVVDSGPESDAIKSPLEAVEPSMAGAVREQLDVSFRAIFGSHRAARCSSERSAFTSCRTPRRSTKDPSPRVTRLEMPRSCSRSSPCPCREIPSLRAPRILSPSMSIPSMTPRI
jgi:hypothetical protein